MLAFLACAFRHVIATSITWPTSPTWARISHHSKLNNIQLRPQYPLVGTASTIAPWLYLILKTNSSYYSWGHSNLQSREIIATLCRINHASKKSKFVHSPSIQTIITLYTWHFPNTTEVTQCDNPTFVSQNSSHGNKMITNTWLNCIGYLWVQGGEPTSIGR